VANASVPFAARVRGRRKPTAQKKDACAVKQGQTIIDFVIVCFSLEGNRGRAG